MLSEKMLEALNEQLNAELYSAYLYLSMAACFESVNLSGMAHWMKVQSKEEELHAMKFFDYIVERNGRVVMQAIQAPPTEWKSALAAFEAAYEHEQMVTGRIHGLLKMAVAEGDAATAAFLQWFVNEQVEEEKSADEVVQKLRMIKDSNAGLMMLDHVLSQRQ